MTPHYINVSDMQFRLLLSTGKVTILLKNVEKFNLGDQVIVYEFVKNGAYLSGLQENAVVTEIEETDDLDGNSYTLIEINMSRPPHS